METTYSGRLQRLKASSRNLRKQIVREKLRLFAAKQHCFKGFSNDDFSRLEAKIETLENQVKFIKYRTKNLIEHHKEFGHDDFY